MSDQVHKTFLACDGLNRTGQQAPASHGENWKTRKSFQVEISVEERPDDTASINEKTLNPPPNVCQLAQRIMQRACAVQTNQALCQIIKGSGKDSSDTIQNGKLFVR